MTDLRRVRVAAAPARAAWAVGSTVCLAEDFLRQSGLDEAIGPDGSLAVPEDFASLGPWAEQLRLLRAFTGQRPMSSRLGFSYQRIPAHLRSVLATGIGLAQRFRQKHWAHFPGWPLDLSADFVADLCGDAPAPLRGRPTQVLLTHDLDSEEGLAGLVRQFLDLEESVGARSCNFVVPCKWPLDHGLLKAVQQRGHEIGTHGFDHSNVTCFLDGEEQSRRVQDGCAELAAYAPQGYRAPSLLRSAELLACLGSRYAFDSSIPTSGGLFPVPNNGCASARPFRIKGLPEIPLSMPRDGSLRFLGYGPQAVLSLWKRCAEKIADSGGVLVLLTHCERRFTGHPAYFAAYRALLEHLAESPRFQFASAGEVLQLWGLVGRE